MQVPARTALLLARPPHSLTSAAPSFAAASPGLLPTCPDSLVASLAAPPSALPRPGCSYPLKTLSRTLCAAGPGKDHAGINLG